MIWIDDYYWMKKNGVLPRQGGKLDQDPKWIEAVAIIDNELETLKRASNG